MTQYPVWLKAAENAIRYREGIASARTPLGYRDRLDKFCEPLPETESDPEAVIDVLVRQAEPGLRAMTGARFFGWVIGGSHPVGVAAPG
jgi:hypothetical protein